jgi:hypothetical protein
MGREKSSPLDKSEKRPALKLQTKENTLLSCQYYNEMVSQIGLPFLLINIVINTFLETTQFGFWTFYQIIE